MKKRVVSRCINAEDRLVQATFCNTDTDRSEGYLFSTDNDKNQSQQDSS